MKRKHIYYYVLQEHHKKIISQTKFDHETCYCLLNCFVTVFKNDTGFYEVPAKRLQTITNNYIEYLQYFIDNNMIFIDNEYVVGVKCRGYKLREVRYTSVMRIEATKSSYIDERQRYFCKIKDEKNNTAKKSDHLKQMRDDLVQFCKEIEIDKAMEDAQCIIDPAQRISQFSILDYIKQGHYYFKRNKTNNRLDTNLTNLKSCIKFYNPGNYCDLDFSNAQPFFLFTLLNTLAINNKEVDKEKKTEVYENIIYKGNTHYDIETRDNYYINQLLNLGKYKIDISMIDLDELNKYKEWTTSGLFYDNFITEDKTRRELKDMMFLVLFSQNTSYKHIKKPFEQVFPTISQFINNFKQQNGYAQFAILLQKIESCMVLDVICPILVQAGIFLVTIHDCFIVKSNDVATTKKIINSVFNVPPDIKTEVFDEVREDKIYEFQHNITLKHKNFNKKYNKATSINKINNISSEIILNVSQQFLNSKQSWNN